MLTLQSLMCVEESCLNRQAQNNFTETLTPSKGQETMLNQSVRFDLIW